MEISRDRILTTHVGSLPRPADLFELLIAEDAGDDHDAARLIETAHRAVGEVVRRQVDAGVDIVSDGELSKSSYTHYVKHRLNGIGSGKRGGGGDGGGGGPRDMRDHPDAAPHAGRGTGRDLLTPVVCDGRVSYSDTGPLERDIDNLRAALAEAAPDTRPVEAFINAASPATLAHFIRDDHYGDHDRFLADLADAMRTEYEAIADAGLLVQIDAPDLAMVRHMSYQDLSDEEFLRIAERNVEALNHATANIPPDAMRMHICWGNYPGPHTHDIPVSRVIPAIMKARPQAVLFEAANPAHAHEHEDWAAARIADDKILIPGVIDTTTNLVEHPRLIAQRIGQFAEIVGRERVIAGTDCGFGTVAGRDVVAHSVVWKKLANLGEGAALASKNLWN